MRERFRSIADRFSDEDRREVAWAGAKIARRLVLAGRHSPTDEASTLFEEAMDTFSRAHAIAPEMGDILNNWGASICFQARTVKKEKGRDLLQDAKDKLRSAFDLDDTNANANALPNPASCTMDLSAHENRRLTTEESDEVLRALARAEDILPGAATYNLACYYGLIENAEEAARYLLLAQTLDDGFSPCDYIKADKDLRFVIYREAMRQALRSLGCL